MIASIAQNGDKFAFTLPVQALQPVGGVEE